MKNWVNVKDRLPKNDDDFVLMVIWDEKNSNVVSEYLNDWEGVKTFRSWEIKNSYTHWMKLPRPKED